LQKAVGAASHQCGLQAFTANSRYVTMLRNDRVLLNLSTLHQLVRCSRGFHNTTKLAALELCSMASTGQTG